MNYKICIVELCMLLLPERVFKILNRSINVRLIGISLKCPLWPQAHAVKHCIFIHENCKSSNGIGDKLYILLFIITGFR